MIFLLSLCLSAVTLVAGDSELARGWGDGIEWRTFDEALPEAKSSNKPIMVLFHKTWCGACKALKPQFAANMEIQKLSQHFVMVNIQDDEDPKDSKFAPDGGYIPRIIFLDSNGDVQVDIINNEGNPSYKYYYPDPNNIVSTMKQVAVTLGSATKDEL